MRPWETWIRRGGISRRQAKKLLEQMERQQLDPLGLDLKVRRVRLADGTRVKLIINKTGVVPYFIAKGKVKRITSSIGILPYILEHGILIIPSSYTVPLTVYTTTELEAYLSGAGSYNPATDQNEYLIGIGDTSSSTCNGTDPAMTWITDASSYLTSYASGVYNTFLRASALIADTNRVLPGLWTGLSRLFAQVMGGSGKAISELLAPISWTPNHKTDGLVRLWDGDQESHRYWYVRITSASGVQAIELTAGVEGKCALAWLAAHELGTLTLSDDDRRLFESWVLRSLYIAGESPSASEVISAAGISDVYADGAEPVTHGWHFSRLRIGTAQETLAAASITTLFETTDGTYNYHTTTTHTIAFSISGGDLAGSLSSGTPADIHIEHTHVPLWYWTGSNLQPYYSGGSTPASTDATGPVYCFYDDTTGLIELTYNDQTSNATYPEQNTHPSTVALCGAESWSNTQLDAATNVLTGGWTLGAASVMSPIYTDGRASDERRVTTSKGDLFTGCQKSGVGITCSPLIQPGCGYFGTAFPVLALEACDDAINYWVTYVETRISNAQLQFIGHQIYARITDWERTEFATTGENGGWAAIISSDDAEAVYLVDGIDYSGETQTKATDIEDSGDGLADGEQYYAGDGAQQRMYFYYNEGGETLCFASPWFDNSATPSTTPATSGVSETPPSNIATPYLVTSHGVQTLSGDYADWGTFLTVDLGDPTRTWEPKTVVSYHDGSGWYYETPSGFTVTDALPESPSTHLYIPIGAS